jgi:hypothetical protein
MTEQPKSEFAATAFMMQTGVVCLIYDGHIPHVHKLEFCEADHLISLIWTDSSGNEGRLKMEFPLSSALEESLVNFTVAAIGRMTGPRKVEDLHLVPVEFTSE